ncbi:hypothetical protein Cpir12675_004517 [Ceratocystis pirilliformis]|uniref:Leucine-rich repeat-containing protein 40 n=1 Tax=Ceratocystis pirilliformis TaxID=259994 RepID=A0ABR3YXG0_9PEZI
MDNKPTAKTGIPRLSKLPVPRTTPSIKKAASRDSLIGAPAEPRTTRLRQSMSRDQLSNSYSKPTPAAPKASLATRPLSVIAPRSKPPVSLARGRAGDRSSIAIPRKSSRSVYTPSTEQPTARTTTPIKDSEHKTDGDPDNDQLLFKKRSTVLTRRPSETWGKSPYVPPTSVSRPASRSSRMSKESGSPQDSPQEPTQRDQILSGDKSGLSLAERTAETLQKVASSPRLERKASSFFDRNLLSPARDGSSRPTSRQSSRADPSSPVGGPRMSVLSPTRSPKPTPLSGGVPSALRPAKTRQSLGGNDDTTEVGFNTLPARPLKPRASINGLFRQPSLQNMKNPYDAPRRVSSVSLRSPLKDAPVKSTAPLKPTPEQTESKVEKSSMALREQIAAARAAARKAVMEITEDLSPQASRKNSGSVSPEDESPSSMIGRTGRARTGTVIHSGRPIQFGPLPEDPFNQRRTQGAKNKILLGHLGHARGTGRLNIAGMGLKVIPPEVLHMYDLSMLGDDAGSWSESVDLTRFVAADNELESIGEDIFPDREPEEYANDDRLYNIFGSLETLDLHGNMLMSVPLGLRRLCNLTSLNLSQNRISNDSLDLIFQILSLRDLKLAKNLLYGPLPPSFSNLINLEVLDINGNNVSCLPSDIAKMNRLRILNLSENSFESLPFKGLSQLPLTEINARKNKINGVLIDGEVSSMPLLQILDLSCNRITHLVPDSSQISFPSLHQLTMSVNKLKKLPAMETWTNLMTLAVDENSIPGFPPGFTTLSKLRHVDFSSNDIRIVPPEISSMNSLMMIRLSGNPLRDKKFGTITTEELKDILSSRLEPPPAYHTLSHNPDVRLVTAQTVDNKRPDSPDTVIGPEDSLSPTGSPNAEYQQDRSWTPPTSAAQPASSGPVVANRSRSHTMSSQQNWPVKIGGILDRSRTESSSLHPVVCSKISSTNRIHQVYLQHNLFSVFPEALSFFANTLTSLSLAHNLMVGESYLTEMLELLALKELNVMSNKITSLVPLTIYLHAPELDKIHASMNRINSLPAGLMAAFPKLTVLQMANNHIVDLDPDTIAGLRIVDVSNNDIAHLNPRLGLLGGHAGLQRLEVTGNRFRVPRWSVLERGTEATLRWLRGRVPMAEKAAWRDENGSDPDQ